MSYEYMSGLGGGDRGNRPGSREERQRRLGDRPTRKVGGERTYKNPYKSPSGRVSGGHGRPQAVPTSEPPKFRGGGGGQGRAQRRPSRNGGGQQPPPSIEEDMDLLDPSELPALPPDEPSSPWGTIAVLGLLGLGVLGIAGYFLWWRKDEEEEEDTGTDDDDTGEEE